METGRTRIEGGIDGGARNGDGSGRTGYCNTEFSKTGAGRTRFEGGIDGRIGKGDGGGRIGCDNVEISNRWTGRNGIERGNGHSRRQEQKKTQTVRSTYSGGVRSQTLLECHYTTTTTTTYYCSPPHTSRLSASPVREKNGGIEKKSGVEKGEPDESECKYSPCHNSELPGTCRLPQNFCPTICPGRFGAEKGAGATGKSDWWRGRPGYISKTGAGRTRFEGGIDGRIGKGDGCGRIGCDNAETGLCFRGVDFCEA